MENYKHTPGGTEEKTIAYLSFTERGNALAERIRGVLGGTVSCARKSREPGSGPERELSGAAKLSVSGWTAEAFVNSRALIYIGAAGIAVRAIAPHVKNKLSDPAVIVADERGRFVIPVLSGHWGGANELARRIADITGGTAVITTATDINGVFAVDTWAKSQNCAIVYPERIKIISGRLLDGGIIHIWSAYPVTGAPPENVTVSGPEPDENPNADARIDIYKPDVNLKFRPKFLALVPRVLVLGVGCRRGIGAEILEKRFENLCREYNLYPEAFRAAASMDIKSAEPGLLAFCRWHGWKLRCFSAGELKQVSGKFHASAFVESITGVDNICERAAVLASSGGELVIRKTAGEGVTFAAARRDYPISWN